MKSFKDVPYDELPTEEEFRAMREAERQEMLIDLKRRREEMPEFEELWVGHEGFGTVANKPTEI